MATKTYWLRFGSGDPRSYSGLSPTFLLFYNSAGSAITPPSITEIAASTGLYTFAWGTTTSIGFLADAATTSPGTSGRYVTGSLDPADTADWYGATNVALGTTAVALGTTNAALGTTAVSWGSANSAALTNQGTTLVAIGSTSIALGSTAVADLVNQGTTLVAFGGTLTAIGTAQTNMGTTLVATGNTSIALGSTILADIVSQGSTLVAIGNTSIALGSTILFDVVNQGTTLVAMGVTLAAIGVTLEADSLAIGSTASSFGTSTQDPVDLYGYLKRIQENLEGDNNFFKLTGEYDILSRGASVLLISKAVSNSVTMIVKS